MSEIKHASIAYEVEGHPDLHCTVLYLGQIEYDKVQGIDFEQMCDRLSDTRLNSSLKVISTGLDWFGPKNDIPVARVEHQLLLAVREGIMRRTYLNNGSQFKDFNPHITIPDVDYKLPFTFWLDGLHLSWGDKEKVYLR